MGTGTRRDEQRPAGAAHLCSYVRSLQRDLERVDRLVDGAGLDELTWAQPDQLVAVRDRLQRVFERDVSPLRQDLDALRRDLTDDKDLEPCWDRAATIASSLGPYLDESQAFIEGSLFRAAGLDDGLCSVADRLLDDISRDAILKPGPTVLPARREAFSPRTWVIGLGFPDFSIWSLPVAVHELGHYAVDRLANRVNGTAVKARLDEARPKWLDPRHGVELFADIFATYAVGPAYIGTLLWRAAPTKAWEASRDHPSWGHRLGTALATLESTNAEGGNVVPSDVIALLQRERDAVAPIGSNPYVPERQKDLDQFASSLLRALVECAPGAVFCRWPEVLAAAEILTEGGGTAMTDDRGTVDVRSVVNGAWLVRFWRGWGDIASDEELARRAMELCRAR
jgi:hypothetical protein